MRVTRWPTTCGTASATWADCVPNRTKFLRDVFDMVVPLFERGFDRLTVDMFRQAQTIKLRLAHEPRWCRSDCECTMRLRPLCQRFFMLAAANRILPLQIGTLIAYVKCNHFRVRTERRGR